MIDVVFSDDFAIPFVQVNNAHHKFHFIHRMNGIGALVKLGGIEAKLGDVVGCFCVADVTDPLTKEKQNGLVGVQRGGDLTPRLKEALVVANSSLVCTGQQFGTGETIGVKFLFDILITGNVEFFHFADPPC